MNAASVRARLNAIEAVERDPVRLDIEERRLASSGRLWSAMLLARKIDICRAILRGQPVLVARLDPEALRRCLRGAPPPGNEFITITDDQLDALNECGPLRPERRAAR